MSSVVIEEATAVYDAVDALFDEIDTLDTDALSSEELTLLLERRHTWRRRLPAGDHTLVNQLDRYAASEELGGTLVRVLADRLRIYRRDAARMIEDAADLGARRALTGEPLTPKLEHTAAGQREGQIGAEQVRIIRRFFAQLPCWIDEPTRADAERRLAEVAAQYRPDELKKFADHLDLVHNPDGNFSDEDRTRRRGITVGAQGPDGMSRLSG